MLEDDDLISVLASLEDSRHQRRTTARPVLGQQEVKLVVDAHHLGYSALHHILEVGVEPGRIIPNTVQNSTSAFFCLLLLQLQCI